MLDDALVRQNFGQQRAGESLNPCYAGRCSSTLISEVLMLDVYGVSILVMLDDALVRILLYLLISNICSVSILVMLDDALVHYVERLWKWSHESQSLLCWTML